MRQTTKYKLNLIESTDTFGPEALNQNAETTERELAALAALAAANQAAAAALPYAVGSYASLRDTDITVTLGFRPSFLIITAQSVTGNPIYPGSQVAVTNGSYLTELIEFTDTGFIIKGYSGAVLYPLIYNGARCAFIAFR